MSEIVDLVSLHEAGHCIAARILGIEVVRAVAGDDPGVRTRYRSARTAAEDMEINERLALVDLAGMAAEWVRLRAVWRTDERTSMARAIGVVILRAGLARDAEVTAEMREEAVELVEELRERAAVLVEENFAAIQRVAEALAGGATLDGAEVDALIEESKQGG